MRSTRLVLAATALLLALAVPTALARAPLPDKTDDDFQNECLAATNAYRAKHHAPALRLDQAAIDHAKTWARTMSQSESLSAGHSATRRYGENFFWNARPTNVMSGCKAAIDAWYSEVKQHDYKKTELDFATGHFTQLVWKATTGMGCARTFGKGSKWYETYVVCNYTPPGNFHERVLQNVQAP